MQNGLYAFCCFNCINVKQVTFVEAMTERGSCVIKKKYVYVGASVCGITPGAVELQHEKRSSLRAATVWQWPRLI